MGAALLGWRPAIAPVAQSVGASVYNAATIERGRLVAAAGDCIVCHTAPGGTPNAGGRAMDTPFGTVYTTNLTPDAQTGLGQWSFSAFQRAMREGISRDGKHLYPAFPYTSFAKMGDDDLTALYAYLMAQPAVHAEVPPTQLAFPFSVRPLMAGWNALFHDATPWQADPDRPPEWNRGAYLVQGVGHCGACHTPRNALGAELSGTAFLSGAMVDGWEAPALTGLSKAPVPWSADALYSYLRRGHSPEHGSASGPMAPVVGQLTQLPDSDIRAMATYLASFSAAPEPAVSARQGATSAAQPDAISPAQATAPSPAHMPMSPVAPAVPAAATATPTVARTVVATPTDDSTSVSTLHSNAARTAVATAAAFAPAPGQAQRLFDGACAACHHDGNGPKLLGVNVPLALNSNLHSDRPDNLLQVIVNGIREPATRDIGFMPAFGQALSDGQIAELAGYMRQRYAPGRPAWADVPAALARVRAGPAHP